jgi:cell wall-associated NlpC family hydrolase
MKMQKTIPLLFLLALLVAACAPPPPVRPDAVAGDNRQSSPGSALTRMGFSIQVGAFSELDNAVGLEQSLQRQGLDAYYFRHPSGLYKVRFSDHNSYRAARSEAERLQRQGIIQDFFIVLPDSYSDRRDVRNKPALLRRELVTTARRFLGVPYRWGGEDRTNGFDCSGLTMVSYRLNGLNLPRNSRAQFRAGRAVEKTRLRQGDLVFFATQGGSRVTHVGLYIGDNRFIHAPRPGKSVRIASLSSRYFRRTYVGARSYL